MIDAAWRLAYRVGFVLARQWWRLRRPDHAGALVALWHDGRVLALRQTYHHVLTFPGGGIERGEQPVEAACRELREELGLQILPAALHLAWEQVAEWDFRRDHVWIFELRAARRAGAAPGPARGGRSVVPQPGRVAGVSAAALCARLPSLGRGDVKEGQGLCPWTPPRAERPLEPIRFKALGRWGEEGPRHLLTPSSQSLQ